MKKITLLTGVFCAVAMCVLAADKNGQRGQLSEKDYEFAVDAAKGSLMEVHMGEMAQQMGTSPAVKNFGQRMVTDHGKASKDLEGILSKKGAALPPNMGVSQDSDMKSLHNKKGTEFDKAYAKHMVKDHKKDVKEFEKAVTELQDPDLKEFASKTLPVLQEHLKLAQDMEKAVGE